MTLRALRDDLMAGLQVLNDPVRVAARRGHVIPEAQLWDRAGTIAMGLRANFRIELLPSENADPMAAIGNKGR